MKCSKMHFLEYVFYDSSFLKNSSIPPILQKIRYMKLFLLCGVFSILVSHGLYMKCSLFAKTNYHPCLDTLRFFLQVFSSLSHFKQQFTWIIHSSHIAGKFFFIKFDHNNSYYPSHGSFMSILQCHYLERFQSRNIKDANQFP